MANIETLKKNLEQHGFTVSCFDTAEEACSYLDSRLDGQTIGIGGSVTVRDMGLYDRLKTHNTCLWHWDGASGVTPAQASAAPVYISSVNGVAETGELINIDNTGNRVGSSLFGHETVYFIIGENKIAPDYDSALWRARNVASPLNAQRLGRKTPCAEKADRCYNCKSPDRICRALTVFWEKPVGCNYEVLLIHENLGY